LRLPREDFDLRRLFAVRPPRTARFRDFAAVDFRAGLFFAALLRGRFFAGRDFGEDFTGRRFGADFLATFAAPTTFWTVFFAAGRIGRPLAAAFPARAPTTPPTTAPTGPATLPIAAPATAPAVCFGIGGIWMSLDDCGLSFFCASGSSGINRGAPSVLFGCNQNVIRMTSLLQPFVHSFRENKKSARRGGRFSRDLFGLAAASLPAIPASAAVASSTAAITTATAAAAATAAARRARLTRPRFIHGQRPAFHAFAVTLSNGILSFLFRAHCYEGKPARFASEFVLHEGDFLHRAGLCEKLLQFVFGRVEGKISYV
jgi:hypothetical protein